MDGVAARFRRLLIEEFIQVVAFNDPTSSLKQRFSLGQTCVTPGALQALVEAGQTGQELFARHQAGDWGEVCTEDQQANEEAIIERSRILSAYKLATGVKVWVLTEADRSVTTILLPDEY
jgi:hypothetical protein